MSITNQALGIGYRQTANTLGQVESVGYAYGATVTRQVQDGWFMGDGEGMTLGSFIYGGNNIRASADNHLFLHEYGHYLQSQASCGMYLFVFGLPSIFSTGNHNDAFPEQDANIRSWLFFNSNGIQNSWNTSGFEIGGRTGLDWNNIDHRNHVLDSRQATNYIFPNLW